MLSENHAARPAVPLKSAHHGSHKADGDFSALLWKSKVQMRVVYEFQE